MSCSSCSADLDLSQSTMLLLALKSLFFVAAILAYSTGVWRLINDYFRQEFRTFLDEEVKKNKYLMVDPGRTPEQSPPPSPSEIISESEVRKAQSSVTANRLLDQMILNFGRLFTAGKEPSHAGRHTSAQPPTNEIITSTSTGEPASSSRQPVSDQTGSCLGPGNPTEDGGTVIESDKFLRSSSPEREDNQSDGSGDDDANADDDGDEEKWIKYWKNRNRRGQSALTVGGRDGDGDGHCEAKVVDACGP